MRYLPFLPSRRLLWLTAAGALPHRLGPRIGLAADALLLALAAADAVAAPAAARLRAERNASPRLSLGADAVVTVTLAAPGLARPLHVRFTDDL
ncbi:MAG TPA: hypothetical protein VFH27_06695, partial [Longimicrobiaceae bacterium]|nr:hypothetical protein [Longimicrobiaceae bacterium]